MRAPRNTLSGYVKKAHINAFEFENQRRTFHTYGYALHPSVDIEGFVGPWGKYQDEQSIARPNGQEKAELEEIPAKRHRRNRIVEDKPLEEKSVLHIKDAYDYQGRSYLHAPHDFNNQVSLRSTSASNKCFLPKSHIHTWTGHKKGISSIWWFPQTAHLLLSGSMDCRVKLWEVFGERRCIRTFSGHRQAIKDIAWNNKGTKFLSASYDRYIKMWDAETGEVISRFTARKMPFCDKFHPDNKKRHLFVAGTSDKKIICWDTRSGDIVQEYDRHLGAVNTITFVDENRRFVTTSDDKSMRIWEWDIPVDMKYIADPTMHSMPAVTLAPNCKWLACQSLDNKIVIFSALNRFKMNRKTFSGHMVSGYACQLDFSPDMSYLVSGDGDGKCYICTYI
ncbi:pre-mRNA-processing factor 17-like [Bactrocera tryoni]|uniref:pre-mRNA-processing factor 17-like n=1 Tax=Bactrocera tryoni TaxID=59916 RepID=UPI001A95A2A1|nr:pre-mRNA-processing factor 17-like [Bactrocera tryoni]